MPRPKKEVEEIVEKVGAEAIAVCAKDGEYVRTYYAEVHGRDFASIADGYAKKIGGTLRKIR